MVWSGRLMVAAAVLAGVTLVAPGDTPVAAAAGAGIPAVLVGGDPIVINGLRCTIGFNARNAAGTRYIITSWPCFGGPGSAGPVPAPADSTSTPYVRGPGGSLLTLSPSQNRAPVGATVCRSGPGSGYHCGTVTALNQTVCFTTGCVTGLTRTNACAEPGDSGGPFIWSSGGQVIAQGVLVGASGNCTAGGTTWFRPIGPILSAYGLILYTG